MAWLHMHRHTIPLTSSLPSQLRNSNLDEYDACEFWGGGESLPAVAERLSGGGLSPAAESGGGSLSSASEVVMFAPSAAKEEVVYDSGLLGHNLVVLAQTMDDENPAVEVQRRRDEEVKISVTQVEVPEGGETQLWVRNHGETARWDRIDASGAVIQSVPASAEDVDPPPYSAPWSRKR